MASILVVCTGNVCRSPIAEGLLRQGLKGRLGNDAPLVASAGTSGWEGSPAMPESVAAGAELGVDISGHVARSLLPEHARSADLVLAMAADHRDAISRAVPDVAGRTFTLKELVRLLEALTPAEPVDASAEWLVDRVAEADALRRSGSGGRPSDEGIVDPLGLPPEGYRAVAGELQEWCARLVDGLTPMASVPSPAGESGVA